VDKKEILRTVSNSGIYCSSDKVGTFSKIPPSTSMQFANRHGVLLVCTVYSLLYSEIALSRKPFGIGHMYMYTFLPRVTDTMTFPPGTLCISLRGFAVYMFKYPICGPNRYSRLKCKKKLHDSWDADSGHKSLWPRLCGNRLNWKGISGCILVCLTVTEFAGMDWGKPREGC
jgi:hypothetical protein